MSKKPVDYTQTQPYRLGKIYQELGERLMDERTDIRDLVAITQHLGLRLKIELIDEEGGDAE